MDGSFLINSLSKDSSSFDSFLDKRVPRSSVHQAEQYPDILDRVGDSIVCLHMVRSNLCFLLSSNGIYIMLGMLTQLTAIYPTLIITLVCVRVTLDVAIETFEQTRLTYHFVAASGPRRHPSIPMPLKDDRDQPAGKLPNTAGIRTPETSSSASTVNINPEEEPYSGSSTQV
ncbi:hypothetical protein ARMGADRAFT_1092784 [Armillaria gallica]|uniref:Uncharacterized protein n=1 Tax=Armillaria gallica TaxID=47427 RepID=A0A2H3C9R8_ARMGA|nr:hypothetical protein ARMGADRAFT_1092784 [Armillaria gallica]